MLNMMLICTTCLTHKSSIVSKNVHPFFFGRDQYMSKTNPFSVCLQLKTAILALVLVGLFIIALLSVDSALSYMLALFLRRPT